MLSLFVWVDLEDLANAIIVAPLLKKFFLVRRRVSLNQVLKLRQVCSEQDTATHVEDASLEKYPEAIGFSLRHPIWQLKISVAPQF
jgi:hypothetical protein